MDALFTSTRDEVRQSLDDMLARLPPLQYNPLLDGPLIPGPTMAPPPVQSTSSAPVVTAAARRSSHAPPQRAVAPQHAGSVRTTPPAMPRDQLLPAGHPQQRPAPRAGPPPPAPTSQAIVARRGQQRLLLPRQLVPSQQPMPWAAPAPPQLPSQLHRLSQWTHMHTQGQPPRSETSSPYSPVWNFSPSPNLSTPASTPGEYGPSQIATLSSAFPPFDEKYAREPTPRLTEPEQTHLAGVQSVVRGDAGAPSRNLKRRAPISDTDASAPGPSKRPWVTVLVQARSTVGRQVQSNNNLIPSQQTHTSPGRDVAQRLAPAPEPSTQVADTADQPADDDADSLFDDSDEEPTASESAGKLPSGLPRGSHESAVSHEVNRPHVATSAADDANEEEDWLFNALVEDEHATQVKVATPAVEDNNEEDWLFDALVEDEQQVNQPNVATPAVNDAIEEDWLFDALVGDEQLAQAQPAGALCLPLRLAIGSDEGATRVGAQRSSAKHSTPVAVASKRGPAAHSSTNATASAGPSSCTPVVTGSAAHMSTTPSTATVDAQQGVQQQVSLSAEQPKAQDKLETTIAKRNRALREQIPELQPRHAWMTGLAVASAPVTPSATPAAPPPAPLANPVPAVPTTAGTGAAAATASTALRPDPPLGPASERRHSEKGKRYPTSVPAPIDKPLWCKPCWQAHTAGTQWFNSKGLGAHTKSKHPQLFHTNVWRH